MNKPSPQNAIYSEDAFIDDIVSWTVSIPPRRFWLLVRFLPEMVDLRDYMYIYYAMPSSLIQVS